MNDTRLYLTLGTSPIAPQAVMDRLEQVLIRWKWGSAGSRADARLVIGELIGVQTDRAADHTGPDPDISLELARSGQRLRIEVTDAAPGRRSPDAADDASGDRGFDHGLHVVAAVAAQWGSSRHPRGGTTLWCELIHIPEPRRPVPAENLDVAA